MKMAKQFKRLYSFLLALIMVLSMIPGNAFEVFATDGELPAPPSATATCPGCGLTAAEITDWVGVTSSVSMTTHKHYRITKDINVTSGTSAIIAANPGSGKTLKAFLDLNGHSITQNNAKVGLIRGGVELTIIDSSATPENPIGSAVVTGAGGANSQALQIYGGYTSANNTTLRFYGGTWQGAGNSTSSDDSALFRIHVTSSKKADVELYGGRYIGTTAKTAGAFNVGGSCSLTVAGNAIVENGTANGTPNAIRLSSSTAKLYIKDNADIRGAVRSSGQVNMTGGQISSVEGVGVSSVYVTGGTFTMDGGTITGNTKTANNGGAVYIDGGNFVMNKGTIKDGYVKSNSTDSAYGGNVYVTDDATFTMNGGTISSGHVTGYSASKYAAGGNVAVDGSGAKFVMNGGIITSGHGDSGSSNRHRGGNVFVKSGAQFDMNGGQIVDGYGVWGGADVLVITSAVFNMAHESALIANIRPGEDAAASKESYDRGVVMIGNDAIFNMTAGTIDGRNTKEHVTGAAVHSEGNFIMTGGTVIGGTAEFGGAIYVGGPTTKISGTAQIIDGNSDYGKSIYVSDGSLNSKKGELEVLGGTVGETFVNYEGKIATFYSEATYGTVRKSGNKVHEVTLSEDQVAAGIERIIEACTLVTEAEVPATCTTPGKTEGKHCSYCDYVATAQEVIPALGHAANEAGYTANENGTHSFICKNCNEEISEDHDFGDWEEVDKNNHKRVCKVEACGYVETVEHTWDDGVETIAPQCTVAGEMTYTCTGCNATKTEEIAALGHNMQDVAGQDATCTDNGYTAHKECSRCHVTEGKETIEASHTLKQVEAQTATCTQVGWNAYEYCTKCDYTTKVEIPKLDHVYSSEITKKPSCVEEGVTTYTCTCGDSYTEAIDELGHNMVDVEAQAATCTEDGWNAHKKCDRCNAYTEGYEVIKAGHDLADVNGKDATCTEPGYTAHKACSKCDYKEGYEVIAAGHKLVDVDAKPKTCTEDGYTAHKACSKCDYKEGYEVIKASHELEDVARKEKTCTEDGYTAHKACSKCDYKEGYEVIPAGHTIAQGDAQPKTCTQDGWDAYEYCTKCDYTTKVVIPAGHTIAQGDAQTKTCTQDGWAAYEYCTECDYTTKVVVPAGHTIAQGDAQTKTCTQDGWAAYEYCTECDYTTKVVVPAGHTIAQGDAQTKTCTQDGWAAYEYCTKCDYTTKVVVPAGHTIAQGEAQTKTCTQDGWAAYEYCTECDYTTKTVETATGHSWDDATCTAPKTCATCGATEGDALGHNYSYTNNGDDHTITCANNCVAPKTEAHTFVEGSCVCGAKEAVELPAIVAVLTAVGGNSPVTEITGFTSLAELAKEMENYSQIIVWFGEVPQFDVTLNADLAETEDVVLEYNTNLHLNGHTFQGTIVLAAEDIVLTGAEGLDVKTTVTDGEVVFENGVHKVVTKTYVAEVDGVEYETLAAAIAAADGKTVKLLEDVELTETLKIPYGTTMVLDLNGKTISQVKNQTTGYSMIENDGVLTIMTSQVGGKISYTDSGNGGNYVSNTITNRGTITVQSGTIENLSSKTVGNNGYPYVIDSSIWGQADKVETNITGGKLYSEGYSAIRLRADSATEAVDVNVTGGEIVGTIEVQLPSGSVAGKGTLNITGGQIKNNATSNALFVFGSNGTASNLDVNISGGNITGNVTVRDSVGADFDKGIITGGTFTTDVTALCAEGFKAEKNGDVYSIVEKKDFVAEVNGQGYETLQAAVDAAGENGTVVITADIADQAVTASKSVTITAAAVARTAPVLNNVSISGSTGIELTVSNLSFTGNSWINSNGAAELTVNNVSANVTPSNASATNSRSAFIALGRSEQAELVLTVTNSQIVSKGGSDPILGWAAITEATISGNTFGSASAYQTNSDSVKFMAIADDAVFNITGNTIYSNYNGIVFAQNTTRGNAYTANISGNTFMGGADHIWVEISGGDTCHGTVLADSTNTINGNAFTVNDIKLHTGVIKNVSGIMGVDVQFNAEGKVIGGVLTNLTSENHVAEGYEKKADGTVVEAVVAAIKVTYKDGTVETFDNILDAVPFKTNYDKLEGATITLMKDYTGSGIRFVENDMVLDLNGFTYTINEGTGSNTSRTQCFQIRETANKVIIKNGTIAIAPAAEMNATWGKIAWVFNNYTNLVVEDVTIDCTNLTYSFGETCFVLVARAGDDTQFIGTTNVVGFDAAKAGAAISNGGTMTIGDNAAPGGAIELGAGATLTARADLDVVTDDGYVVAYNNGVYTVEEKGLEGSGTEANPFLIKSLEDLILFRDSVNAGETKYNAAGLYFVLTADIDLAGENWVGIGSATADHGFMGNFDGNGFAIKNLTITNPALDADGYAYAGLFAVTEGAAGAENVIENLIIENVTISTTGDIVAAAIAYPYYTTVKNVTVCGDINITGGNYTAGALAYTRRCVNASNVTVSGNAGSTITGKQVVGGVISDIQMNGGLTANYSNFSASGLTITGEKSVGGISGIICKQTLNGATVKDVTLVCDNAAVGTVAGSWGDVSTITNVVVENVTGATAVIGATYKDSKPVQAKIGDTYYATFAAAYAAAEAGETVTLLQPIVVAKGETLTLDKDVTVAYTSNVAGEDMITVRGTLNVAAGTITYNNTDKTGNNVTVSTISCEPGSVLNITGGAVENKTVYSTGSYAYAIDLLTNGNMGDVTATISGGKVYSDYMAIRQFNNGTACANSLTISGGEIYGAKRAIQVHLDNDAAVLAISGGVIEAGEGGYALCLFPTAATKIAVSGGEFVGTVYSGTNSIISGGTFDEAVYEGYVAPGYKVTENSGVYGVVVDSAYGKVAKIGDTYYADLHEAMVAAKSGETVELIADVDLAGTEWEPVSFAGKFNGNNFTIKNLTINKPGVSNTGFIKSLNGTFENVTFENVTVIGGECTGVVAGRAGGSSALAQNITVTGTIQVETTHSGYARAGVIVGGWAYGNYKNITVDGVDKDVSYIKHSGSGDGRYVAGIVGHADEVDSYINCTVTNITISGGWLCGGIAGPGPSDGLIEGCVVENVNINADYSGGMFGWSFGNGTIKDSTVKDVAFVGGTTNNGAIGGYGYNANATVENITIENVTNGGKALLEHVAEVDGAYYFDLQAAIDAAVAGETVKLLKNVEIADTLKVKADDEIVLDLNGKTISQSKACTASYEMISNKGKLTITGDGKISLTDTGAGDSSFGWGSYTIRNEGTLVVENGTIEFTGAQAFGTHCSLAIFQYSGSTVINGGKIINNSYRSLRLWKGDVTINGGEFQGQVWVHCVDDSAKLTINGGSFAPAVNGGDGSSVFVNNSGKTAELSVTGGTFATKIGANDTAALAGAITGGQFSESAKNNTSAAMLSEGLVFAGEANAAGYYELERGLKGTGTETDPYLIETLDDLIFFRDSVNAGETKYNADGVYVALAADIDMTGADWSVNIGDDCNATFDGIFDGKNFTISNLSSTETAKKADGYICTGLFGAIAGNAQIKNLTIKDATINVGEFPGNNVSAVVGFAWKATGSIENVKVEGLTINAANATGVGAILGYDYYSPALTVENCSVTDATINGKSYVGGVVGYASTKIVISDCAVEDATITATGSVAGIAGILAAGGKVENATVKSVDVSATGELWANSAAIVAGTITKAGSVTISGTTYEDVNVTAIAGGVLVEKPTAPIEKVAAKIGDTYYATFAGAFAAAEEGQEITLLVPIVVNAGETLTLDKAVTISYTSDKLGEAMITNNGELNLDAVKLVYTYTGAADSAYSKGNYTVANNGKLTLTNGATIENATAEMKHASYAITNGNGGEIVLENGLIKNTTNYAVRMFGNGSLTVNGGEIIGTRAVWMQAAGNNAADAPAISLTVNGGKLTGTGEPGYKLAVYSYTYGNSLKNVSVTVNGGEIDGDIALTGGSNKAAAENVTVTGGVINGELYSYAADEVAGESVNVSGGTFAGPVAEAYCAEGYIPVENADGTYGVKIGTFRVQIGTKKYETLAEAIAAAVDGDTIELLTDCTENVTITQKDGLDLVIDGKGYTYNGKITVKGRDNDGAEETLTIKNINFASDTAKLVFIDATKNKVQNLTVQDCTFTSTAVGSTNDIVAVKTTKAGNVTVKDCVGNNVYYLVYNTSGGRNLVVDGCTVNGFYGIRVHNNIDAVIKNCELNTEVYAIVLDNGNSAVTTIENCEISVSRADRYPVYFNSITGDRTLIVKGTNDFNRPNGDWVAGTSAGKIKVVVEDANLTLTTGMAAKIGNTYYNTLQYAFEEAVDGDTITLVNDCTIDSSATTTLGGKYNTLIRVAGESITLDLNGKKIYTEYSGTNLLVGVFSTEQGGQLTLTDSSAAQTGTVEAKSTGKLYALLVNYDSTAHMTVEAGNYILDNASDSLIYTGGNEGVVVNGGYFHLGNVGTGANGMPWIFNASGQNTAHVIVTGGTFNADVAHQYYEFEVSIPYTSAVKDNGDGTWSIAEAVAYVTEESTSSTGYTNYVGYATVHEAINAAEDGEKVVLLTDAALTQSVEIAADKAITLDLNNFELTSAAQINVAGKLTIVGDTAITGIVLTDLDATVKAVENLNVTSGVTGYRAEYEDGVYFLYDDVNVAINLATGEKYADLQTAINAAAAGVTVQLMNDVNLPTGVVLMMPNVTLDLNGHTLNTFYFIGAVENAHVIDTANGEGLMVATNMILNRSNEYLAIAIDGGYRFAKVKFGQGLTKLSDGSYRFQVRLSKNSMTADDYLVQLLNADGVTASDYKLQWRVKVSWTDDNGAIHSQRFAFSNDIIDEYIAQFAAGATNTTMNMTVTGAENLKDLTFTAQLVSLSDVNNDDSAIVIYNGTPKSANP